MPSASTPTSDLLRGACHSALISLPNSLRLPLVSNSLGMLAVLGCWWDILCVQAPIPWNFPWIRPSDWHRSIHSTRVLRLDSYRIRLASSLAGLGEFCGRLLKLFSLIFQPVTLSPSSLSVKSFVLFTLTSLSVSMCVVVLSVGDQPELCRTSMIWL